MKILIALLLVMTSCGTKLNGPNYNSGKSHNSTLNTRSKVVNKEDSRMKGAMYKLRNKSKPSKRRNKSKRKHKKYI
jgi:hypothetical protein